VWGFFLFFPISNFVILGFVRFEIVVTWDQKQESKNKTLRRNASKEESLYIENGGKEVR